MVIVAQLVRASVCGTEGRGFDPRHSPFFFKRLERSGRFFYVKTEAMASVFLYYRLKDPR